MSYIASAVSRANLRELAVWIRAIAGYENKPYFPIVEFYGAYNAGVISGIQLRIR